MKPAVKKIIARDRLIIIFLLFLAGISFFLSYWFSEERRLYEVDVQVITPVFVGDKVPQIGGKLPKPEDINLHFPKNTNDNVIKITIKRDFPNIKFDTWYIGDSPIGKNINASYNDKGERVFDNIIYKIDYFYVFLFFLFIAYPLYLLGRFLFWAIVTKLIESLFEKN